MDENLKNGSFILKAFKDLLDLISINLEVEIKAKAKEAAPAATELDSDISDEISSDSNESSQPEFDY